MRRRTVRRLGMSPPPEPLIGPAPSQSESPGPAERVKAGLVSQITISGKPRRATEPPRAISRPGARRSRGSLQGPIRAHRSLGSPGAWAESRPGAQVAPHGRWCWSRKHRAARAKAARSQSCQQRSKTSSRRTTSRSQPVESSHWLCRNRCRLEYRSPRRRWRPPTSASSRNAERRRWLSPGPSVQEPTARPG